MISILVVSDDEILLRTRVALLARTGAEIVGTNSHDAIGLQYDLLCDLVVLCHTLPPKACAAIAQTIRQRWPRTRTLLVTPQCGMKSAHQEFGVDDTVPSEPYLLINRVCEMIGVPPPEHPATRRAQHLSSYSPG